MPRSPRMPPSRPIDDDVLRQAGDGQGEASKKVARAVGLVISRVVAQRAPSATAEEHERLVHRAWRALADDGFAALGQWSSTEPSSFEQHVADALQARLDAADELAATPSDEATAWTPALVAAAIDGGGALGRELARYVYAHVRACAVHTLRTLQSRLDVTTEALDLAQELAVKAYERDGALLRRWDPARGRTTLHGYLHFVARREIVRRIRRAQQDAVIGIDEVRERELPISSDVVTRIIEALRKDLVFQLLERELDDDDRALLEQLRSGVSTERGARILGISDNAYYQRKHRLIAKSKVIAAALDGPGASGPNEKKTRRI